MQAPRPRSRQGGIWQRITGKSVKLRAENEDTAYDVLQRDPVSDCRRN